VCGPGAPHRTDELDITAPGALSRREKAFLQMDSRRALLASQVGHLGFFTWQAVQKRAPHFLHL